MKRITLLAVLLLASCVTLPDTGRAHKRFCAEVERLGWFDNPMLLALGRWTFAPDPHYPINPHNPDFRPSPADTVNCYCYSERRQQTLAVCPADPWVIEDPPAWFVRHVATVNPLTK